MKLLPVALQVQDKLCLVVGGGNVAARKVRSLLEYGARVHVVAPQLCAELEPLRECIEYSARGFQSDDCDNCMLVFACTDDRQINAEISRIAERKKIWCHVADDGVLSTLHGAAAVRRDGICIGITTAGASPALAKHLKSEVEKCVGEEYAQLLRLMGARREKLKSKIASQSERAALWRAVLDSEVLDLLRAGKAQEAEQLIDDLIDKLM